MANEGGDEIRLTATFVDQASTGLRNLQTQLQSLGGGQSADHMTRMRRNMEETQRGIKPFFENIEKAGKSIIPEFASSMIRGTTALLGFGLSTTGAIAGIGALAAGFIAANKAYGDFAEKMIKLGQLSTLTGVGPAQIKEISEAYERMGLSAEEATRDMMGAASALVDLNKTRSEIRAEFLKGHQTPEQRLAMERALTGMSRQDVPGYINMVRQLGEVVYQNVLKENEGLSDATERAAKARADFARVARVEAAPLLGRDIPKVTAEEEAMQQARIARAREWQEITAKVEQNVKKIFEHFTAMSATPLINIFSALNTQLERFSHWLESHPAEHPAEQLTTPTTPPAFPFPVDPNVPATANPRFIPRGQRRRREDESIPENARPQTGELIIPGLEGAFAKSEATKTLRDGTSEGVVAGLREYASLTVGGGIGGGGGAGGGRAGIGMQGLGGLPGIAPGGRFGGLTLPGGGGMPDGDGGMLPYGSQVGPGIGKGAGESPAGAVGGGGDPSLGGNAFLASQRARFAEELQQNPDLRYRLAAITATENPGAGPAVVESLMNRMNLPSIQGSLAQGTRGGPRSFYGPARRGLLDRKIAELKRNPTEFAKLDRLTQEALAGSNVTKGYTDQGSRGDPNYEAGGTGVNIHGERFNLYAGPGGRAESERFRQAQQAAVRRTDVDRAMNEQRLSATGKLTVDVNAPKGTRVGAEGGGLFKSIEVNRQTQMEPAASSLEE